MPVLVVALPQYLITIDGASVTLEKISVPPDSSAKSPIIIGGHPSAVLSALEDIFVSP
jgi:hypothetical protein